METTITLTKTAGRVVITVGGETLATVKDGAGLIARVDRKLAELRIYRYGFTATDEGMVATGADLR